MSIPGFSPFPPIPQRSTPEADFDAKMYALFQHFATTHRNELLAFIEFLETNSTVIGAALNGTTIGLTDPAAAKFTTLEADSVGGGAVQADGGDLEGDGKLVRMDGALAAALSRGGQYRGATAEYNIDDAAPGDAGLVSVSNPGTWPPGNNGTFAWMTTQRIYSGETVLQRATFGYQSTGTPATPVTFERIRSSGGSAWSPWSKVYSQASLLGTVSESGGTPTGAVIERGSNANGEYVRFADGTQICISPDFTNLDVTETTGALYRTAAPISWTPPAGFGGAISMSGAVLSQGNSRTHWGTLRVLNSNSIDISVFAPTPATDRAVRAMVIGRWF
ncbi:hypothetical protein MHM88_22275 [Epibacterium sp. MM17-32]|uniref:hypothetical protein n=1 Tax=Epibacterium sp. MM17-32 TaxID=2917734 RepID=UPI001EF4779C|nr:hypothetical protein [Epibacterium sp. MM17-32]MCG7630537.1 hypothetical protein [Epibacterium sp. MM17-32]